MVNLVGKATIVLVALIAALYQFLFKSIIFDLLGYGRVISPLHTFNNVRCEKIDDLGLEGCEDMWLHEPTGFLYMSCGDSKGRMEWLPAVDHLNTSGRGLNDRLAVLDTRGSGTVQSRLKWITPENYGGSKGDSSLYLHGFDVLTDKNTDLLRILLVNHRPSYDSVTGKLLDARVVGANSTIEQFHTKAGTDAMRHIRTYADPLIATPNRVAWVNDHAFVFSNDHSAKTGVRRQLDPLLGGGNVGYCSRKGCNTAFANGLNMPNGLVRGRDGLIYVPNTTSRPSRIDVFSLTEDHLLHLVDKIIMPYPIDNLSVDRNGDIYAAGFPQVYRFTESTKNPFGVNPPSAVFRIRRVGKKGKERGRGGIVEYIVNGDEGGYEVEKVMEDNGTVLPSATVAIHDAETGRMFLGGAMAPFVTICETI